MLVGSGTHEVAGTAPPVARSMRAAKSRLGFALPLTSFETVAWLASTRCAKSACLTPLSVRYLRRLLIGQYMHHMNIHVKHTYSRSDFAAAEAFGIIPSMNISTIRRSRGLTQTDLAEMTHLTQPTISRAERGDDSTTMATLTGIAAALGVPLADLFTSERSAFEAELLKAFRQLPPDRQKGWLDMARMATQDQSTQAKKT